MSTPPLDKMLDCPALVTIKLISGKWKTRILWHLREGAAGFGELKRAIPRISPKVLTEHLAELVDDGLVTKTQRIENNVVHVDYSYSPYGLSLVPVLDALGDWGIAHARPTISMVTP